MQLVSQSFLISLETILSDALRYQIIVRVQKKKQKEEKQAQETAKDTSLDPEGDAEGWGSLRLTFP